MNWLETRKKLTELGIDIKKLPEAWEWRINLRDADLRGANLIGADLRDADLRDADLRDAYLRGANLRDANLIGADLRGANLRDADLRDADLRGADLGDADLGDADLRGSNLGGANLRGSNLGGANLRDANLRGSNLGGANLRDADLRDANLRGLLKVENLDKRILETIESGKGELEMSEWHTCNTTHCRAGWAITFAGDVGKVIECIYGPSVAGALIYASSYPSLPVPDFLASNEEALADIRKRAGIAVSE